HMHQHRLGGAVFVSRLDGAGDLDMVGQRFGDLGGSLKITDVVALHETPRPAEIVGQVDVAATRVDDFVELPVGGGVAFKILAFDGFGAACQGFVEVGRELAVETAGAKLGTKG